jgi:RHS repeat-associated protein
MLWSGYTSMQGFTGHEHMYELELIHMNGRVYDPTVGRFLQADVVVQSSNQILSYNRYAYVWNNPLAYTDPSGYQSPEAGECSAPEGNESTDDCQGSTAENVDVLEEDEKVTRLPTVYSEPPEEGLLYRTSERVKDFGVAIYDSISYGFNAIKTGGYQDYQDGGVVGVIIGATGGRSNKSFMDQVNADYAATSIVFGSIKDIDKKLTSVAMGGFITRSYGGYSALQVVKSGPAAHLGTYSASARLAVGTTIVNSVIITASYELANYTGSLVRNTINRTARLFE